jgi:transcription elongation GreA/GreB family factor
MHSDLAKLLEAGRINPAVAARLDQLSPGSFCLHKAWGAGKVVDWDLAGKKVTIDFEQSTAQVMDLQFALQKTEPLDAGDFRAKKVEQLEELRSLAKSDPVGLVVHLLESHGGTMSVDLLEKEISGAVVGADDFKKWWEGAKRTLRDSKRVIVPTRRTEPLTLRPGSLSPADALVSDFEQARDLKTRAKALEAITRDLALFKENPEALQRLVADIDEASSKGIRIQLGSALELMVARDQLIAAFEAVLLSDSAPRIPDVLLSEESRIAEAISTLPAATQRAIYDHYQTAFGDRWISALMNVFDKVGSRGVAEIAKLMEEKGERPALVSHVRSVLARRQLGTDALIWVCRERNGASNGIFSGEVGACILILLENDHLNDGPRKTTRLQTLLSEDKQLLGDIVAEMDSNEARNFGRRLMECPVFNDLDRKSLLARVIKARPETGDLVSGNTSRKEEALIVSWHSLERKKAELDDIIRNRIPQNTKDIAIARSYGDLRENFEYKSAKDMQKVLMRRKSELEREVDRARGTDFKDTDTSSVNIGTTITLKNSAGETSQLTVLGAWDSDPEKNIVSYLSEAGAVLLGAKVGETVSVRNNQTDLMQPWVIDSIQAYQA